MSSCSILEHSASSAASSFPSMSALDIASPLKQEELPQPAQQPASLRVFMTHVHNSVLNKMFLRLQERAAAGTAALIVERDPNKARYCDIIISDRHSAAFFSRQLRAHPTAARPLLNFFEAAEKLTLKISMCRLLESYPPAAPFHLPTFVLVPQQQHQQQQKPLAPLERSNSSGGGARRSALPSKAERLALAAAKTGVSATADDRDKLAAAMAAAAGAGNGSAGALFIAKPTAGKGGYGCLISSDLDEILAHVESFDPSTCPTYTQRFGSASSSNGAPRAGDGDNDEDDQDDDYGGMNEQSSGSGSDLLLSPTAPGAGATRKSSRSKFVVQRYVERPLLVHGGRKFDIRVWCALSSAAGGAFEVFVFSEASCRLASAKYDTASRDPFVHVTNHDLQKWAASGYGDVCPGNEMWLDQLSAILQEQFGSDEALGRLRARHGALLRSIELALPLCAAAAKAGGSVFETIVRPQIHNIIVQSFCAARPFLEVPAGAQHSTFQLLGFDIILDQDLHASLIEINGAPGCAECLLQPFVDSALDQLVVKDAKLLAPSTLQPGSRPAHFYKVYAA